MGSIIDGKESSAEDIPTKRNVKKTTVVLPLLLLTMATAVQFPAMASSYYETEVVNGISMGDIDISINEYEHDENGNEVNYVDQKMVLPGQKVDKIVRITNNANTAWIRAKLEYTDYEGLKGFSDSDLVLASDKWIKKGDYFYYTEPVAKNQYQDLIKQVVIPSNWSNERADATYSIYIIADAVQTSNFTPNFESDDPWFGTVIEQCVHTKHDIKTATNDAFKVTFEGGSDGLVKVGDDFFKNWGSLMPGDVVTDKVTVGNDYNRGVSIYFKTETIADDELLKALHLTIKEEDKVIYDGTMDGAVTKGVYLGYFTKGETAEITYTVSVPSELNNKYALMDTKTKWIFSCSLSSSSGGGGVIPTPTTAAVETQPSTSGSSSGGGGSSSSSTSEKTPDDYGDLTEKLRSWEVTKDLTNALPRLGENKTAAIAFFGGMALLAAGAICVLKKRSKESEEEEKHEEKDDK